ncbi:MAG: YncE family protein [Bacteroidota bacterium]
MSHLFRTDTSIFKAGDNIFKVNDKLNVIIQNQGGFGATIEGLRFDPVAANTRAAISSGSTCRIIDTTTFALIATISLGGACIGMAWDSPNNKLYITAGGKLYETDTTTWAATDTGLTSGGYNGVALDPNTSNNRFFISGGSTLYVIDKATYTISATITSGLIGAYGLAFDPLINNRLYIGNYASDYVSVVDTDSLTIIENINGFSSPIDISFDPNPANNRFLVSEYSGGQVAYVSRGTHGIQKRVNVTNGPEGISCDPNIINNRFLVASVSLSQYLVVTDILS